jgi:hypothetical protein
VLDDRIKFGEMNEDHAVAKLFDAKDHQFLITAVADRLVAERDSLRRDNRVGTRRGRLGKEPAEVHIDRATRLLRAFLLTLATQSAKVTEECKWMRINPAGFCLERPANSDCQRPWAAWSTRIVSSKVALSPSRLPAAWP